MCMILPYVGDFGKSERRQPARAEGVADLLQFRTVLVRKQPSVFPGMP